MADVVDLPLIAGEPYSAQFRVTDGVTTWPTYVVRAEVRRVAGSPLLFDLTPHLVVAPDPVLPADLLISLDLTGAQTRTLQPARWDLYISEGAEQATARRLVEGAVTVDAAVTDWPTA